jgi:hypothetical protein
MLKALIPFLLVMPFVSSVAADEPESTNPLTGVSSIYINADMATRLEIRRVLQRELPKLKYPSKVSEADVVVEIRTNLSRIRHHNRKQDILYLAGGTAGPGMPTRLRPIDQGGPKLIENGLSGIAIRGDTILLIHHGVSSALFPAQFAKELAKAWRGANSAEPAPQP